MNNKRVFLLFTMHSSNSSSNSPDNTETTSNVFVPHPNVTYKLDDIINSINLPYIKDEHVIDSEAYISFIFSPDIDNFKTLLWEIISSIERYSERDNIWVLCEFFANRFSLVIRPNTDEITRREYTSKKISSELVEKVKELFWGPLIELASRNNKIELDIQDQHRFVSYKSAELIYDRVNN